MAPTDWLGSSLSHNGGAYKPEGCLNKGYIKHLFCLRGKDIDALPLCGIWAIRVCVVKAKHIRDVIGAALAQYGSIADIIAAVAKHELKCELARANKPTKAQLEAAWSLCREGAGCQCGKDPWAMVKYHKCANTACGKVQRVKMRQQGLPSQSAGRTRMLDASAAACHAWRPVGTRAATRIASGSTPLGISSRAPATATRPVCKPTIPGGETTRVGRSQD